MKRPGFYQAGGDGSVLAALMLADFLAAKASENRQLHLQRKKGFRVSLIFW
jgi:hypothetical protein